MAATQCEEKLNLCVGLKLLRTVRNSDGCKTIKLSDSANFVRQRRGAVFITMVRVVIHS